MQLTVFEGRPGEGTAIAVRLLMFALAAAAVGLSVQPIDPRLLYLGIGYVVFAGAIWWLAPRFAVPWLANVAVLVDIAAVTALLGLSPPTPLPLWVLYVLPIIIAGMSGTIPAALAAGLSAIAYLAITLITTGMIPLSALWPVAVFVATAVAVSGLFARRLVEQQEKVAWQEIAAGRPLAGTDEPEEAAAAVVERARRLARAKYAWLWWNREGTEHLPIGARAGVVSEEVPPPFPVTSDLLEKLSRGPVPLGELNAHWVNLSGEMFALGPSHVGDTVAVGAVAWSKPPRDRAALRERLRVFAPWAAEALSRSLANAEMREAMRCERVLRHTAAKLSATLDRQEVLEATMIAGRAGLNAAVSLVERPSGRIVAGDADVAEAFTRLAVQHEAPRAETPESPVPVPRRGRPRVVALEENLALVAWRADPPLEEEDASWLEELAAIAREALERCTRHDVLRHEEERLRASMEAAPAPVTVWDKNGNLVIANEAFRSLGLKTAPPGDVPASGVREAEITTGEPPRTFMILTTQVAEGRYLLSLYREITRERQALRAKDELISLIGHELRSPLTSIQGYSQMMSRQLAVVQRQVDELNRMIGDFVEASKAADSRLPLRREMVDMAAVTRAAVERFRGVYPRRTVRLELAEVPFVEGDPGRLGQVLDNLLNNAAKYSPEDSEMVLSLGVREGRVVLSVQDQGVGIAPEHMPHLFERFYRAPTPGAQSAKGLGLGLSIVRDIVAAHEGYVWAESAGPNKGSTFRVSLPAMTAAQGGAPPSRAA